MSNPGLLPLFGGTIIVGVGIGASLISGVTLGGLNFGSIVERRTQPATYWMIVVLWGALFLLLAGLSVAALLEPRSS